jgi:nucleoside-diphosphate-sugar epimerase
MSHVTTSATERRVPASRRDLCYPTEAGSDTRDEVAPVGFVARATDEVRAFRVPKGVVMGGAARELVLVTGGSGFVATYCVAALLTEGYRVRTTVRDLTREDDIRAMVKSAGVDAGDALSFETADLLVDEGWSRAVAGCTYVLHVASPFPLNMPSNADELIIPARDGAMRVLAAARDGGVRRVVLTSSFAAVGYSPKHSDAPFNEDDWTDPDQPGLSAYVRSKTIAERAAWDYISREGDTMELSVINPVGVLGPVLGSDLSTSIQLVKQLLDGKAPGLPRLSFGLVDVRDVADLHLRAMTSSAAAGERFLAVSGESLWIADVARILREQASDVARRVPSRQMPDWTVRLAALFNPPLRHVLSELGQFNRISNDKAQRILGWTPRPNDESIVATARSLAALGLISGVAAA